MMFRFVVYLLRGRCPYIWQCSRGKVLSGCESHATGYCSALLGSPALEISRPPALRSDLPADHTCTTPPFQNDPKNTRILQSNSRWSVKWAVCSWWVSGHNTHRKNTSPRSLIFLRNLFSNTVGSTSSMGTGWMEGSREKTLKRTFNSKIQQYIESSQS